MNMEETLHGLQVATLQWNQLADTEVRPTLTRLSRLAAQAEQLESLAGAAWPDDAAGPAQDHHAKLYTGILVYLAYWLAPGRDSLPYTASEKPKEAEPFFAGTAAALPPPAKVSISNWSTMPPDRVTKYVRGALIRWSEAVKDRGSYAPSFRHQLRLQLSGPFVAPLPRVFSEYDPLVLPTFLDALVHRLRELSSLPGRAAPLTCFIAEVASPFWAEVVDVEYAMAESYSGQESIDRIGRLAESVLPLVFESVDIRHPELLTALEHVLRAFRLFPVDSEPELRERLSAILTDLEAILDRWRDQNVPQFIDTLNRAMRVVRPAISGLRRQLDREYLGDREIHSQKPVELRLRKSKAAIPCRVTDISCDLGGIGILIDATPHSISTDGRSVKFTFPYGSMADLKDCELRIPFRTIAGSENPYKTTSYLTVLDLEPCWVKKAGQNKTRLGCRILSVKGNLDKFLEYLAWEFTIFLKPQERFYEQ